MNLCQIFLVLLLFSALNGRPTNRRSATTTELENLLGEILEESEQSEVESPIDHEPAQTEDDVILTHAQKVAFGLESENEEDELENDEDKRKVLDNIGGIGLWPGAEVPWSLNPFSPVLDADKATIRQAVQQIEEQTCVTLPELSWPVVGRDHLQIGSENGCWSFLGRTGGGQKVSIGNGCGSVGVIIHELSHAIGFYHEQSRSDRDEYVRINPENIMSGKGHNFDKAPTFNLAPFDENSVMMYSSHSFSTNGKPTIVGLDKDLSQLFGNRDGLTFYDRMAMNVAYGCASHCSNTCHNGGFLLKDCTCMCPKGLTGQRCEEFDTTFTCGGLTRLLPGESTTFSTPNYPSDFPKPARCAWVFVAPTGTYLEMEFQSLDLARDTFACKDSAEVRHNLPGQTGIEYCLKPARRFSTYRRMQSVLSVFLEANEAESIGFTAVIKAEHPSACSTYPCFNDAACTDNGNPVHFTCSCPTGISGTLCEVIETATVHIDFESGLSPMTQLTSDDSDWETKGGPTPTWGTGPDNAQSGLTYLFVESSRSYNRIAGVATPLLVASRPKTVKFYYHMKGMSMGSLSVVQHFMDGREITLWSKTGDQGDQWNFAQVTIAAQSMDYYVHFVAATGSSYSSDMALDNIVIETDMSGAVVPTTTTTTTATPIIAPVGVEFNADFEADLLPFSNTEELVWELRSGPTPSSGTGPNAAFRGNSYAYFETSISLEGSSAVLRSPIVEGSGTRCLEFYYHMYGADMGSLAVEVDGTSEVLWSKAGDQGNLWHKAEVSIQARSQSYRISFRATKGYSYRSDIAIDDVSLKFCGGTQPVQPEIVTGNELVQDFETDFAGFDLSGDYDWIRQSGPTPSALTGPSAAISGHHYIFLESSSPMTTGQKCLLTTTDTYSQDICVSFCWHMYGSSIGTLNVGTVSNGYLSTLWTRSGDLGNMWNCDRLSVYKAASPFAVRFEGVRGISFTSDIALDNIRITMGLCQ